MDGTDYEIFFYNGTSTIQLTNNSYEDSAPQISRNIVWYGLDGTDYEIYQANFIPQITVAATDANAGETVVGTTPNPGIFTLTRSESNINSLTVNYTITGTATNGTDYSQLTGTATFAAGSSTTTITVTPTDDLIFEGNETVTLTLATGTGYTLGTAQTATVTIADNDTIPQVSINDLTITEGNSGTRNANFIVSLSNPSSQTISVNYQTVDDDATTANNDYVATNGIITFTPGQTTKTLPITINGDTVGEINEAFTVLLSNPLNATLGMKNEGIGIIRNDDSPSVTVTAIYSQATESGAPGIFQLNRTGSTTRPLTVNYNLSGTATNGTDYSTLNGVATFASGSSTAIILVNPTEDTRFEGNETAIFNLLTGTGYTVGTSNGPTITIVDNDPRPEISINDANVTEGDSGTTTLTFEVTLSNPSSQTITVNYQTSDFDATVADADYVSKNEPITFNPGEVRKTVDITVNGDTSAENDELFEVNLLNPAGASIKDGQGFGKIHNDDTAITVTATDADAAETPLGTTPNPGVFTITRQGVNNIPLTVNFSLTGKGINGSDYTSSPATATFLVNSNTTTVNVTPTNDNIFEGNEDVILTLKPGTGYSLGTNKSDTVSITDDDPQPQISINDVTLTEGDSGTTTFNFTVTLSNPSSQTITVAYQTSNVDAVAGTDYVIKNGSITFNSGETTQPLSVIVNGDTSVEDNETFKVNLSTPVNATIADGDGIGTINNDDIPTLTVNSLTVVEGLNNNAIMTFTLSTPSNKNVSFNYITTGGTATAGQDYTPVSGNVIIPAGATTATLSIPILNDNVNEEPNETFNLVLSNPVGVVFANANPVITITDTLQIQSNANSILPAGVENLELIGTGNIDGTGNTGDNILTGNSADNTLAGGDGNDTYRFNATRVLGSDTIQETSTVGVDVIDLTGTTAAATLNLGLTTIQTVVTNNLRLTLTANIENIIGGNGADRLTGNSHDNSLVGGSGDDNLRGNGGDDSLTGDVGNDILTGGAGSDRFIYSSGRAYNASDIGLDQISDFTTGDKFVLSKATFNALQSVISSGLSQSSDLAVVNDDNLVDTQAAFIVYSSASGNLFYNQNGGVAGLGTGGTFADLLNTPTTLTAADFIVI